MAELQKFIQASNGAFKSDLMKSFVAKYKGEVSQSLDAAPGFNTGGISGASLFAPSSPAPSTTTTTPTTTPTTPTTGTDNANANILIQEGRTDNVQTSTTTETQDNANTTESNQNTINANRNTTITTSTTSSTTDASQEEPDSNANMTEVAAVLEEVRGAVPETRQLLVGQVTEATVDAHLATCINTHQAVNDATARFMARKEAGQLPDMNKLSLSASAMWEMMMDQMMPEMGKAIKFCKMLPGFHELCLDDQMLLVKQGTFEVMMTRFSMLINHEKETMMDPSHQMVCPRKVISEMPMGQFLDGFFRVGTQFNPIGLTDSEIGVFTAVLAFSPSRPGLKETKLIATIQSLYQQALFTLMKQNHSDPETKFSQVLSLVPMFRRINQEHSEALSAMKTHCPDAFDKFPPLHKELYPGEQ